MILRGTLGVLLVAVLWPVAACSLVGERRSEAESIQRDIDSMPAVQDTDLGYIWSIGERRTFLLDVRLAADVTEEQAVAIGATFVDRMNRGGLAGHDARLNLRLPAAAHPNPYVPDYSQAKFWYNPAEAQERPDRYKVIDSIGLWLRAVRSPATALASLTQPMGRTSLIRTIDLTLNNDATDGQTAALSDDISDRADVFWRYMIIADDTHRPHQYQSNPVPPLNAWRTNFSAISKMVDTADDLRVHTSNSAMPEYANTSVTIEISDGPDRQQRTLRTAEAVAQLLSGRGEETTLRITGHQTATVVVDGCYFREGYYDPSELELHLSGMFETC